MSAARYQEGPDGLYRTMAGAVTHSPYLRPDFAQHLFDENDQSLSNLLDVFIYKLRQKLGKDFIQTRRGSGYIVAA